MGTYKGTHGLRETFNKYRKQFCLRLTLTQVQLRLPKKTIEEIDQWVKEGRFKSRSDAIRIIISLYEEREKTREFLTMLTTRSEEAEERPETLIPLEEYR